MKPRFLLTLLLAIALVSCRVGNEDLDLTPQSTPPPRPLSDIEQILNLMPDTEESRLFTRVNNYKAMAETLGIEMPGPDATGEEVERFVGEVFIRAVENSLARPGQDWISGYNADFLVGRPGAKGSLGFDARDISLAAVSGEGESLRPNPLVEVVTGDIDASASRQLLNECAQCAEAPEVVEYAGLSYYAWGEDFEISPRNSAALPAFDRLGRGGRLYMGDSFAFRALRTQDMERALDVQAGNAKSLGEQEDWALAAKAIDGLGALSVIFTNRSDALITNFPEVMGLREDTIETLPADVRMRYENFDEIGATVAASSPELPEFEVAATGTGWDGERAYAALSIVFADEAIAQQGLEALRDRAGTGLYLNGALETLSWADLIESSEFSVNGRVVSAKIMPADPEGEEGPSVSEFIAVQPFLAEKTYVPFLLR